jgi:hypothetical protein
MTKRLNSYYNKVVDKEKTYKLTLKIATIGKSKAEEEK